MPTLTLCVYSFFSLVYMPLDESISIVISNITKRGCLLDALNVYELHSVPSCEISSYSDVMVFVLQFQQVH